MENQTQMTAQQIEYRVEKLTNEADHAYMNNNTTTEEYRAEIKGINDWAEAQYAKICQPD